MNEHDLKELAEKIARLTAQYQTAVTQTDETPAAVIAAEKALNSNSSFLMRSRMQSLSDVTVALRDRRNAVADGAWNNIPADKELYDKLGVILKRWSALGLALRDRAEFLEKAAEDKRKRQAQLLEWHAERRENAIATEQCRIDRAKCLASRKDGSQ